MANVIIKNASRRLREAKRPAELTMFRQGGEIGGET